MRCMNINSMIHFINLASLSNKNVWKCNFITISNGISICGILNFLKPFFQLVSHSPKFSMDGAEVGHVIFISRCKIHKFRLPVQGFAALEENTRDQVESVVQVAHL